MTTHRRMYEGPARYALNGDELLSSEAWEREHGHAIALDRHGHEYTRGLDEVLRRGEGGNATLESTWHGRRRVWRRDPESGRWNEDLSAAVEAPRHADALARRPDRADYFAWYDDFRGNWRLHGNAWIVGAPGTGKTFAADTALRWIAEHGIDARRLKWHEFATALQDSFFGDDATRARWTAMREDAGSVAFLVLDDFGAGKPTPTLQDAALALLDRRIEANLPSVVTSNLTPAQLRTAGWDARLTSRLGMFRTFAMGAMDWRRMAA
jgi:hypothetical protein